MTKIYFSKRQEPDGTWTVVTLLTGEPAKLNGQFCCNLRRDEAQEITNYMNMLGDGISLCTTLQVGDFSCEMEYRWMFLAVHLDFKSPTYPASDCAKRRPCLVVPPTNKFRAFAALGENAVMLPYPRYTYSFTAFVDDAL